MQNKSVSVKHFIIGYTGEFQNVIDCQYNESEHIYRKKQYSLKL